MVTAGATANISEGTSRAAKESGLLCSHSHGESIGNRRIAQGMALGLTPTEGLTLGLRVNPNPNPNQREVNPVGLTRDNQGVNRRVKG